MAERMRHAFAVVGVDENGNEGIACYLDPDTSVMTPLLGSEDRLPELRKFGAALAVAMKSEFEIVRFSGRSHVETLKPYQEEPEEEGR